MIAIASDVWQTARKRAVDDEEWHIAMLLRPRGDAQLAAQAVPSALDEVALTYRSSDAWDAAARLDEAYLGDWRFAEVSKGVRLDVSECDEFDVVLPMLAAALERRGVSGSLGLYTPPPGFRPPRLGHAIVGRARVRGKRVRTTTPGFYLWAADHDAFSLFLGAAERWCRQLGDGAEQSIRIGGLDAMAVPPDEEVLARLIASFEGGQITDIATRTDDEFRLIRCASPGTASFAVGGARLERGDWQGPLAELTDLLRANADVHVYAFVRRAWDIGGAMIGDTRFDWPRRPDAPRTIQIRTLEAFEDVLAQDAYGAQLLGPGYATRLPEASSFRAQPSGTASVWLEHTDPAAWFAAPAVPFTGRWDLQATAPPTPPMLAEARAELAPILQTVERLEQAGLTPRRDLQDR